MTNAGQMKSVLDIMQKNKWFYLYEIHNYIESHIELDDEDMKSHNDTGGSYPKWKQTLHGVLSSYKKKGKVEYIEGISSKTAKDGIKVDPQYKFK